MSYTTAYTRHHPGKYGLLIDWETSGSEWGGDSSLRYQGIAFGVIVFDTTTYDPVDTLYRELHFDDSKYEWSSEAEKIHGLSRAHLAKNGMSREEALADLIEMMLKYWPPTFFAKAGAVPDTKVLIAGHNTPFDMSFTNQLVEDNGLVIVFHHVTLNTSELAFAMTGVYRSDDVFKKLAGVDKRGLHNALEDAAATLDVLRNLRQTYDRGVQALS